MKIERVRHAPAPEPVSLTTFADKYDLTLEINEQPLGESKRKFWVRFKGAEVKDGAILAGVRGDGPTEYVAIASYVAQIKGQLLVIDAMKETRREIQVPADLFQPETARLV